MRFHVEQYQLHENEALAAIRARDFPLARREMLLAARYLLESARDADPQLRAARIDKAKRLKEQSERLGRAENGMERVEPHTEASGKASETDWTLSEKPNVHFSDVAGLDELKQAIQLRVIYPVRHPDIAERFHKRAGGGVLLYGPPGTGKTMIARAIATELDARFFNVKASNVMSPWVGVAEKNFARLFEAARKEPLSVVFLDEAEALVGKRGSHSTVMNRVIPEFLAQVDGMEKGGNALLLIGATNRPWDMDEAALRPGRFGEKFYVGLPDEAAREQILRLHLEGVPGAESLDWTALAEVLKGYSGADIAGVCLKATDLPFQRQIVSGREERLTTVDLRVAIGNTRPSINPTTLERYERFEATA